MGQADYPRPRKSNFLRDLFLRSVMYSLIVAYREGTFYIIPFYVVQQGHEHDWIQGAEVLVENILFGVC